jgi:ferritin-like metal-binding protein YciE
MAGVDSLKGFFKEELKDLHSAESQIIEALPKMEKAASSQDLKRAFQEHLEQTREQKKRIEQVAKKMNFDPTGKKCVGMQGLIKEGEEILKEDMSSDVRDAALIAAAQKVEHYEIAGYGTAVTYAEMIGASDAVDLLKQTLNEEEKTDKKLTKLATSHINKEAMAR